MEEIEQGALQSFAYPVTVWKRYVDDTFVVVKEDRVDALHEHLNDQCPGITFTVERENGGRLPFLDIEVRRQQDSSVKTAVYRKATHTDSYLNFKSHHSSQYKQSVITALVRRGETFDRRHRQIGGEGVH